MVEVFSLCGASGRLLWLCVYLFRREIRWGALYHVVWCLSCCFPAIIAFLLIGLRDLYSYMILPWISDSSYIRQFL
jgi:hypothetical protein